MVMRRCVLLQSDFLVLNYLYHNIASIYIQIQSLFNETSKYLLVCLNFAMILRCAKRFPNFKTFIVMF
ncbi:hypothetical protein DJ46_5620 (plasmid) [Bacillus anthracis str. Vollum]|nr:hypothetical protein DJ44_5756 [Bacillus anthracis]AIK60828.1 hypothetical protein DJ46_5620 [Bacillus anthracis str. Vollum]AJG50981.1 hypothetical protein AS53_5807 [Bacillus anthracis str. Turkey32]AJH43038.1 hypothetical protein AW20_5799 [Bacillus anthracis str. Sterne]AJH96979.1 hypothetical protein AK39_5764 [Bacillus anthracis str. V770-NP-1R]AJI08258.1 hypothetical protein AQ16_5749 [Bacillus cereus G9241]